MEEIAEEEKEEPNIAENAAQEAINITLAVVNLNMLKIDCAPELVEEQKKKDEALEYYRMPKDEDMYIPPGRKPYDRDELNPSENDIKLGPPTLKNDEIYRQQYAIKDYAKTLRETIEMNEVNSKLGASHAIKPAIKNSFYINEQRAYIRGFVEPDDEANLKT